MSTYNNLHMYGLAKGEGVAMSCHSGKLLNVHWKWNSYKSVDNFVEHYNTRIGSPLFQ